MPGIIDYIIKLQLSIPKRINAFLDAKGRHIDYQWFLSYQMWQTSNSY